MRLFPSTRISIVEAVASADAGERERALNAIATAYWVPAYRYLSLRWSLTREDAEDVTQELFARAADQGIFARYDPSASRFRTYLRLCLDSAARNAQVHANRQKRGGGAQHLPLEADGFARAHDVRVPVPSDDEAEQLFRREWLRALFSDSVEQLRERCLATDRIVHWTLFERYDLDAHGQGEQPTYAELARECGLPVTQVTNHLAWARREFRKVLLERLRASCGSDREFREEARELLGVKVS